jgi:hypothetical protein
MKPDQLYKQTYAFERRTLQLGEQSDGFSGVDLNKLSDNLDDLTKRFRKQYSCG